MSLEAFGDCDGVDEPNDEDIRDYYDEEEIQLMSTHETPRRIQLEKMTPAEHAIRDCVAMVEALGADVRLTDAVVLLGAARDSVADYIDGVETRRFVRQEPRP